MGSSAYADLGYGAKCGDDYDVPESVKDWELLERLERKFKVKFVHDGIRFDSEGSPIVFIEESHKSRDWRKPMPLELDALAESWTPEWNERLRDVFVELKIPYPTQVGWHMIASYG